MPIERKILKSGGSSEEHYATFTVIFETKQLTEADTTSLREEASTLLKSQAVMAGVDRKIDLFVRNSKTVGIFHYTGSLRAHSIRKVEADFDEVLEQIGALLDVYDTKSCP